MTAVWITIAALTVGRSRKAIGHARARRRALRGSARWR